MSIKVMSWYWDHSKQDGHKLLLLLALADWCDDEGDNCYPRVTRLAQRIRRKPRATQAAIRELEKEGEILVYPNMGKGPDGRRSSLYYLLKYREAMKLEIPPIIAEAAQHYREKSRKQGMKGIEVRKAQATLPGVEPGVQPTTPPTGAADNTPTGAADNTPTGAADNTQIRQLDPSVLNPSEKRGGGDHSPIGNSPAQTPPQPAPAPLATPLIDRAVALAEAESFDGPKAVKATNPPRLQTRRMLQKDGPYFKQRDVGDGDHFPAGKGTNPVQIYFERFSPYDHKLSEPQQDDMVKRIKNLDLWRAAVTAWDQAGFMATNRKGMFEWYDDPKRFSPDAHKPGTAYANGAAKPAATADLTFKQWLLKTYYTDVAATVIYQTKKTEQELRNEYEQWLTGNRHSVQP